ncbi:MAG: N-acetylmuramidase family protein [Deltaproteobacteria bacterium]|nr:N-acetylmuramidase family protein [Deltaproteobacteria bacterium]
MKLLRKGSRGEEVKTLQQLLVKHGYNIDTDGIFGSGTEKAVRSFQAKNGLDADGLAGKNTWAALEKEKVGEKEVSSDEAKGDGRFLNEQDISDVALEMGVEIPAIKAVYEVESRGKGFLDNGDPKILFEGHIFWRQLKKKDIDPEEYQKGNEDILYPKWDRSHYKGGVGEYDRLGRAREIDEEAALCSASWGTFQIMGFNHKKCGFKTVKDFVDAQYRSEREHLKAFVNFINASNLLDELKNKNWAALAKGYNGPAYAENKYDVKLEEAYKKYAQS